LRCSALVDLGDRVSCRRVLIPLSPSGGEGRVRGFSDALLVDAAFLRPAGAVGRDRHLLPRVVLHFTSGYAVMFMNMDNMENLNEA
jgi:hypothetical protein